MICLLGVDLGTSGTKTVLFDAEGREVASQRVEYPLYQPQNGWAEQDPRDWWNAAVSTIRGVLEKSGVNPGEVKGLGWSCWIKTASRWAGPSCGATAAPSGNATRSRRPWAQSASSRSRPTRR